MKNRRWIALVCGASLLLALTHRPAQAQTSSSGGTGLTGSSLAGSSGSSSSGGLTSQTVSPAIGSGLVTSATTIAASSGTPSATSTPSSANPWGSTYVNYFTLGQPQNYQGKFGAQNVTPNITGTFGKYIYVANPSTSTGGASASNTQQSASRPAPSRAPGLHDRLCRQLPRNPANDRPGASRRQRCDRSFQHAQE